MRPHRAERLSQTVAKEEAPGAAALNQLAANLGSGRNTADGIHIYHGPLGLSGSNVWVRNISEKEGADPELHEFIHPSFGAVVAEPILYEENGALHAVAKIRLKVPEFSKPLTPNLSFHNFALEHEPVSLRARRMIEWEESHPLGFDKGATEEEHTERTQVRLTAASEAMGIPIPETEEEQAGLLLAFSPLSLRFRAQSGQVEARLPKTRKQEKYEKLMQQAFANPRIAPSLLDEHLNLEVQEQDLKTLARETLAQSPEDEKAQQLQRALEINDPRISVRFGAALFQGNQNPQIALIIEMKE